MAGVSVAVQLASTATLTVLKQTATGPASRSLAFTVLAQEKLGIKKARKRRNGQRIKRGWVYLLGVIRLVFGVFKTCNLMIIYCLAEQLVGVIPRTFST